MLLFFFFFTFIFFNIFNFNYKYFHQIVFFNSFKSIEPFFVYASSYLLSFCVLCYFELLISLLLFLANILLLLANLFAVRF